MSKPIVVFDVDMVLGDGRLAPRCEHAQVADVLVRTLHALGFELHAWSAGLERHARTVVKHGGWSEFFTAYHDKAEYPTLDVHQAMAILGRRPSLQIDDDLNERIADWTFLLAEGWYE